MKLQKITGPRAEQLHALEQSRRFHALMAHLTAWGVLIMAVLLPIEDVDVNFLIAMKVLAVSFLISFWLMRFRRIQIDHVVAMATTEHAVQEEA